MTTKLVKPDADRSRKQKQCRRKANRIRKIGAFATVAAIGLAMVACTSGTREGQKATTPADAPQTRADESPAVAPEAATGPFFLDLRTGEQTPLAKNLAGGIATWRPPTG